MIIVFFSVHSVVLTATSGDGICRMIGKNVTYPILLLLSVASLANASSETLPAHRLVWARFHRLSPLEGQVASHLRRQRG